MKSHTFLPTFIRYSFIALIALWIVYLLADMHINKIPGFSLEEGFLIAGELLVFIAIILARIDTKPTELQIHLEDSIYSVNSYLSSSAVDLTGDHERLQ